MPEQPKKYRIVLKSLAEVRGEAGQDRNKKYLERLQANLVGYVDQIGQGGPNAAYYEQVAARTREKINKLQRQLAKGPEERVIDADFVKQVSDKVMLVGINPGNFISYTRGFMGGGYRARMKRGGISTVDFKRNNPEFYNVSWVAQRPDRPHDDKGAYELTRKFEKVLSMNINNIISINGKPVMNTMELDPALQHLEFDDEHDVPASMPAEPEMGTAGPALIAKPDAPQDPAALNPEIEQIAATQGDDDAALDDFGGMEEDPRYQRRMERDELDFDDDEDEVERGPRRPLYRHDDEDEPMESKLARKSRCLRCERNEHEDCPMIIDGNFCNCPCDKN